MGTTCTAAVLMDRRLFVAQVGDSRCYVLRGGVLKQITRDQSLLTQLMEAGQVKPEDAPKSYFDLTDPKWKGRVAVASMGERTTAGWLAAILALKGEDFTRQYVEGLRANGLKVLQNNTDVRKAVASGEQPTPSVEPSDASEPVCASRL